jgi:ABC-type polysaccharide/polyol phosphate export permease
MAAVETRLRNNWRGDYGFLIRNLILKDFRVRYRNASLGVFWSLLNPLVMMTVFWFVFTRVFTNSIPNFPVFLLCGLVPFNFFTLAWATGTTCLVDNTALVKRVSIPREIIPISSVLSNCMHFLAQIVLLLLFVVSMVGVNRHWVWLPVIWGFEVVFVCGLVFIFSAVNVYVRDTRYVVESCNTVLIWLVPIFYPFSFIAPQFRNLYQFNPMAAIVLATRNILLESKMPPESLLVKLAVGSTLSFLVGLFLFRKMRIRLFDHL